MIRFSTLALTLTVAVGAEAQTSRSAADTATLLAELKSARPGSVITLAPGTYSGVVITGVTGPVTITGRPGAPLPVFTDLSVVKSRSLTFSGLDFDASSAVLTGPNVGTRFIFLVGESTDIHFDHLKVHGSPTSPLASTPSGMFIRYSDEVSVTDSDFSYLHSAFQHGDDSHLTVARDAFHNLWDDAIRGGGSSFVTIDANHCFSNHPDLADPDHPDCIQFWTSNTKTSAHDITITNNRYERGTGTATQFIFVGNELGIPYQDVTIRDNVAEGSQTNAIAIGIAKTVDISGNRLTSLCAPVGGVVMVASLVTGAIDGLTLKGNVAGGYTERAPNKNVSRHENAVKSCR